MSPRNRSRFLSVIGTTAALATVFLFSSLARPISPNALAAAKVPEDAAPPAVAAPSVEVMDFATGQVLYAKDANARRFPASTTKLMTLLLALEHQKRDHIPDDALVPVTDDAYKVAIEPGVQSAYTYPGEKWTFQEMIQLIAVYSANDACVSVADYLDHSEASFAAEMNTRAKAIGMNDTHFVNSHGLHDPNHYTTAHDMALLARQLVTEFPGILKVTGIPSLTIRKTMVLDNTDELLGKFTGLDGLKTGFTDQAGYCFIGTAKQNGMRLLSVVLDAPSDTERFSETASLLNFGFSNYKDYTLDQSGQVFGQMNIKNGKTVTVDAVANKPLVAGLQPSQYARLEHSVRLNPVSAPIRKGETVGQLTYTLDGNTLGRTSLVARTDDPQASLLVRLGRWAGSEVMGLLHSVMHLVHRLL